MPTHERKPMRLALCITGLEPGGAERCLVELATRLDRNLFEPAVYSLLPRPDADRDVLVQTLEAANVPLHFLGVRRGREFFTAVRRLATLWTAERPEIVQSFLFHANLVSRFAASRASVPHVVSGIRVAERRGKWRLWLDRMTASRVERHVCVSQSVADFSRLQGLPAEKLLVIPNGVDLERFKQAKPANLRSLGVPTGRRVVTTVGRLDRQKGIDRVLKAAAQWRTFLQEHDLLIVGSGPDRELLQRVASVLGVGDRVHFVGWRADVPEILKASDLVVLASRWEGMPNVLLEAMAAGRPVVTTDVEGVRELLGPLATSQVVSVKTAQALAGAVVAILMTPGVGADLGADNQRRVTENFAISRTIQQYADLYSRLAQRENSPPEKI